MIKLEKMLNLIIYRKIICSLATHARTESQWFSKKVGNSPRLRSNIGVPKNKTYMLTVDKFRTSSLSWDNYWETHR